MADILVQPTGTGLKDFLSALVKPLQTNSDLLETFQEGEEKRATWNGQKIVLQAALNDIFGIVAPPYIIIELNQSVVSNLYFYESSEIIPVTFFEQSEDQAVFFGEDSEIPTIDYDFKVLIPVGIYTAELERQVRAQTNLYKIVGPRFVIETY